MPSPKICHFSSDGRDFVIETVKFASSFDRSDAFNFMQNIFRTNEPITCALQCSASDTSQIFANICANCFKFDLSLAAKNADGEVIAIALNALCDYNDDDWKKKNDGNISAESENGRREFGDDIRNGPYASKNANRLAVFIDWVERDGGVLLAPGTVRRAMKLEIIAVHPENGRLGLASNLLRSSIQLAHSFGCSHLITCATAVASQNLFRKFGFKTIRKVPFHSFLDDGVPIFAGVHDNGEGAELMILSI
ncbi:hypothetical protein niasHT_021098 [Heterodera trifolii]|uniref:N-acetyltransferase domain-containing protein n=1 Tax=Heterodera trifolii TaxID=157864 RepID=A0ABD2JF34_9BILA